MCDGFAEIGKLKAVIVCGLVFSFAHLSLAQTVHQFAIGCLFAYIYMKTDNILLTMLMHVTNNLLAVFLSASSYAAAFNNITVLLICFALGIIIAVGSLFLMLWKEKKMDLSPKAKTGNYTIALIVGLTFLWALSAMIA